MAAKDGSKKKGERISGSSSCCFHDVKKIEKGKKHKRRRIINMRRLVYEYCAVMRKILSFKSLTNMHFHLMILRGGTKRGRRIMKEWKRASGIKSNKGDIKRRKSLCQESLFPSSLPHPSSD